MNRCFSHPVTYNIDGVTKVKERPVCLLKAKCYRHVINIREMIKKSHDLYKIYTQHSHALLEHKIIRHARMLF